MSFDMAAAPADESRAILIFIGDVAELLTPANPLVKMAKPPVPSSDIIWLRSTHGAAKN